MASGWSPNRPYEYERSIMSLGKRPRSSFSLTMMGEHKESKEVEHISKWRALDDDDDDDDDDDSLSIENQVPSLGFPPCRDLNSPEEFNTTINTNARVVCLFYYQLNWVIENELSKLAREFPEISFVKIAAQKVSHWFREMIYTKFPIMALIENGTPKHFLSQAEIFGLPYVFNTAKIKTLFHQCGMIIADTSAPFLAGL